MTTFVSRLKEENVDSLRELTGWRRTDYWDAGLSTADADFYMPLVRTFWEAGHPRIGEARDAARRLGHGIRVLAKIDRLSKKGDNPNDLRVLLCGTREQDLDKIAAQHTTPPETKDEATIGVSHDGATDWSSAPPKRGLWTISMGCPAWNPATTMASTRA